MTYMMYNLLFLVDADYFLSYKGISRYSGWTGDLLINIYC